MSPMRTVLGIDAAWTSRNASGVALAVESKRGWALARVASSYASFLSATQAPASIKPPIRVLTAEASASVLIQIATASPL